MRNYLHHVHAEIPPGATKECIHQIHEFPILFSVKINFNKNLKLSNLFRYIQTQSLSTSDRIVLLFPSIIPPSQFLFYIINQSIINIAWCNKPGAVLLSSFASYKASLKSPLLFFTYNRNILFISHLLSKGGRYTPCCLSVLLLF